MKFTKLNIQMFANVNTDASVGGHERSVKYGTKILENLKWDTPLRVLASKEHEGDLQSGHLKIPVRDLAVTIAKYDPITGAKLTQSKTSYIDVYAGEDVAIYEQIDKFTAQIVPDNIVAQRLEAARYSTATSLEFMYVNALLNATSKVSLTETLTTTNAYKSVLSAIAALRKLKVKKTDMALAINIDAESLLKQDIAYTNTASELGSNAVRSGIVGFLDGVKVIVVDYLPDDINYMLFVPKFTFAGEIFEVLPTIENLTNEFIGSSALKARMIPYNNVLKGELVTISSISGSPADLDEGITAE